MIYTSLENKKIKLLQKLKKKKYREELSLFLVEGKHLVEEAKNAGVLETLIVTEGETYTLDVETMIVTKEIMKTLSDVDTPQMVLGVCRKLESQVIGRKLLLLDGVQDPGNLGTILRSSVAFHIDTVVLGPTCVDLYNPKVIRSSQGMIFHQNILTMDLTKCIQELKEKNIPIFGTKVDGGNSIKSFPKREDFAIIMGNEGNGVSTELLNMCDDYLYIDMKETCESLNVAVATSIILYELDK